jgi:HK97 family phage prohead protease
MVMNTETKEWLITAQEDENITMLEKAVDGRVTLKDITDALEEYKRLFTADIASPAEILTLYRAFPNKKVYTEAVKKLGLEDNDNQPMVLGGPASIEVVDREGHLITTDALKKAFGKYMENFRTRNAMVLHSDVQVGWALPAYISKSGNIFKSGVDDQGLYFITELRDDTKISKRVEKQIDEGKLRSYSIAGSATKTQQIEKGMEHYMQVDDLELAEVTVCEKGVNQEASFQLIKSEHAASTTCVDGSCLVHLEKAEPEDCGCDGPGFKIELMEDSDGTINLKDTLVNFIKKQEDPMNSGKSFATLNNIIAREQMHHQLLDEQGFPGELEAEDARYTPVTEYDPATPSPPWLVNESGQDLGNRHVDDALTKPGSKKQFQSSKVSPLARLQKLLKADIKKPEKMLDTDNDVVDDDKETELKKLVMFQKRANNNAWAIAWGIVNDTVPEGHPWSDVKKPTSKEGRKALAAKIAAGVSDNPWFKG